MEQRYRHYAEFERPDLATFQQVAGSPEFAAAGKDAAEWASRSAHFADLECDDRNARSSPDELGFSDPEKAPPRATITLNRPDVLNAFDYQMLRELARRARTPRTTTTSASSCSPAPGGRSASAPTSAPGRTRGYVGNEREYWKWFSAMEEGVTALRRIGKPTLARINGICVGGGNEIQMACDLAVMVDDAFIRHVGLQHGSVPAAGATQWLPLIVGDRRAREIIMLCEEIPAAQALEWGLVNRVVSGRRSRRDRRRDRRRSSPTGCRR